MAADRILTLDHDSEPASADAGWWPGASRRATPAPSSAPAPAKARAPSSAPDASRDRRRVIDAISPKGPSKGWF